MAREMARNMGRNMGSEMAREMARKVIGGVSRQVEEEGETLWAGREGTAMCRSSGRRIRQHGAREG